MTNEICNHKFVYLRTVAVKRIQRHVAVFSSTDFFYCEKCLDEKSTVKREEVQSYGIMPSWFPVEHRTEDVG